MCFYSFIDCLPCTTARQQERQRQSKKPTISTDCNHCDLLFISIELCCFSGIFALFCCGLLWLFLTFAAREIVQCRAFDNFSLVYHCFCFFFFFDSVFFARPCNSFRVNSPRRNCWVPLNQWCKLVFDILVKRFLTIFIFLSMFICFTYWPKCVC